MTHIAANRPRLDPCVMRNKHKAAVRKLRYVDNTAVSLTLTSSCSNRNTARPSTSPYVEPANIQEKVKFYRRKAHNEHKN